MFCQNIWKHLTSNISKEIYHDHFYNAFITNFNVLTVIDDFYNIFLEYAIIHDDINMLNGVILGEEICNSLKTLKKSEAAGSDGLVVEMFLYLCVCLKIKTNVSVINLAPASCS